MATLVPSDLIPRSAAHRAQPPSWTDSSWARWNRSGERYLVGVEEEVMLLDAHTLTLAQRSDTILPRLSPELSGRVEPEAHTGVVELASGVHERVGDLKAELKLVRRSLISELAALGFAAAAAGTHPASSWVGNKLCPSHCCDDLRTSLHGVMEGPPTMALHVHVCVPDPEDAVLVYNAFRCTTPLLLALSANSPFFGGRDRGLASERTILLERFPRSSAPRRFASYRDYVQSVDPLIRTGVINDPTDLWWDVRLQPELGTVEVRLMDSQTRVLDTAALVALVQALARRALVDRDLSSEPSPEEMAENRFLAARDGVHAQLIDERKRKRRPATDLILDLLETCKSHAVALGCEPELRQLARLARANGADRQRAWIVTGGTPEVMRQLAAEFA